jgi:hypothetical protein
MLACLAGELGASAVVILGDLADSAALALLLEEAGFEYQIHASLWPVTSKDVFQDVLIGAYR